MIFSTLFKESYDLNSFTDSLRRNYQAVSELYEMPFRDQFEQKDSIEQFILLKVQILSSYKYSDTESKSFLLILLDFCERFCLYSCIPHVVKIIVNNNITISKRMFAGIKSVIPKPTSNQDLVDRFESICSLLSEAIEEEEDNNQQSLITFLNYYDHIVINTNQACINKVNEKISKAIAEHNYPWIISISDIVSIDPSNIEILHQNVEDKIDSILNRDSKLYSPYTSENILIETCTNYSKEIATVPNRFLAIRQINYKHANGILHGRGVEQLTNEEEMYEYIKRYGKMHYAKIMSAFEESFPQNFNQQFDIIDWGCGQALATISFIEKYGNENITSITLVEPSEIVIKRAALHCKKFAPRVRINTIRKTLNDTTAKDFYLTSKVRIHLFSNILDIDDYRMKHLTGVVDELLSKKNYFICVSPYVNDIKSAKLQSFMKHFENLSSFTVYHDNENTKQGTFWACNNSFGKNQIFHGDGYGCGNYDNNGCNNKWTRVLKVFSV